MRKFIFSLIFISGLQTFGQPNTEIYLFDLKFDEQLGYSVSSPVNISNNEGYDNQPHFWPDGNSIIYARAENGQTEIARYFIGSGKTKIISNTLQGSEYSPTPTPDGSISSIRLDTTGLQLLYKYDLSGDDEVLVEDLVVGYHVWLNKNELAAFVLGDPNTLQLINLKKGKQRKIAENIGRSLHLVPSTSQFSFLDKSGEQWVIKSYDPRKLESYEISMALEGSEDFCWTARRELLMGKDSQLWIRNGLVGWTIVADLKVYGLTDITRLSISPDGSMLAVVVGN